MSIAIVVLCVRTPIALGEPGDLDVTFAGDGIATTNFGRWETSNDVAVQPDGKIVLVGESHQGDYRSYSGSGDFVIARYRSNGTLDPTFGGGDGKVSTPAGHLADARAVALQPDGKIVIAGKGSSVHGVDAVARYNPDGSLDTTFSGDGISFTMFAEGANAVAVQPDGKIVYAGHRSEAGGPVFAVARLSADGSFDPTFSGDGRQTTAFAFGAIARDVVLQPDGRIVVAGGGSDAGDFAFARYNADGSPDTTFSDDGLQTVDFGTEAPEVAAAVVLQPDGSLVAAGGAGPWGARDFALTRLTADGSPDTSFSEDGRQLTDIDGPYEAASDLALQPNGKIVVVGSAGDGAWTYHFVVARVDTDGSLDETFAGDGTTTTVIAPGEGNGATSVALQADGRIVVGGDVKGNVAVVRYENDDRTPPQTSIASGPFGPVIDPSATFTFASTEAGSTFECSLDAVAFATCASPVTYGSLAGGEHTFAVRAIDPAGNVDPSASMHRFTVVTCTISGSPGGETVTGTSGDDVICGLGGNDVLKGLGGNDILVGGPGNDVLVGGAGADVLGGEDGSDQLDGGAGGDDLFGGGGGTDRALYADRTAPVTVTIGSNADDGESSEGDHVRWDVEEVRGGKGNDTLTGDARDNLLIGGPGADTLRGGDGNDGLQGSQGADVLDGGVGDDVAIYSERTIGVTVTIGNGADDGEPGENDDVRSTVERVRGGKGGDHLTGTTLADVLDGGPGADVVDGGGGQDQLLGGDGADQILAADGERDKVNCGAGSDVVDADPVDRLSSDCEA